MDVVLVVMEVMTVLYHIVVPIVHLVIQTCMDHPHHDSHEGKEWEFVVEIYNKRLVGMTKMFEKALLYDIVPLFFNNLAGDSLDREPLQKF